jgi:hypothetical protein
MGSAFRPVARCGATISGISTDVPEGDRIGGE